jgi:SagB-type dehydrogenase family enzyme
LANRDTDEARRYHEETSHTVASVRASSRTLDWPNRPRSYKVYRDLEPQTLPEPGPSSAVPALEAVATPHADAASAVDLDLARLAHLLHHAAGIVRRKQFPGGELLLRAASCTGALYQFEVYLVAGEMTGLEAGVYHWSPADASLRCLRAGDLRGVLARATANEPAVVAAPVTAVLGGTYWRNSWKYGARAYRHFGWDNGTILANLLAVAAASGVPAKLVQGFVDSELNELLGLETEKEVAFSLVPLGAGAATPPAPEGGLPSLELEIEPLSQYEVDYPVMRTVHEHSSLADPAEVAEWRGRPPRRTAPAPADQLTALDPVAAGSVPDETVEQVILRRGSTRRFGRKSIDYRQLSTILERSTAGISADFLGDSGARLNELYVIVHAVDGLAPGSYYYDRGRGGLELLREGVFREKTGFLGLEQALPADAAACIFYLADLDAVLSRYGNRGYRAVQTEAGILGGKAYLAAYAQRVGATGLTFYDQEVVDFFSPHAAGLSAIFLVAVGKSAATATGR